MSRLIIIRGNSGSGKSTTAKRLQRRLGYGTMLIPQDVIRREIIRVHDEPNNPAIQLMKDVALYDRNIGYDVIIEGILDRERYGTMLRKVMAAFDETYVYYFDVSLKETLRRHQTKPNAHEFGERLMRELYIKKDVLDVPGERLFTDVDSADDVLECIVQDLR